MFALKRKQRLDYTTTFLYEHGCSEGAIMCHHPLRRVALSEGSHSSVARLHFGVISG